MVDFIRRPPSGVPPGCEDPRLARAPQLQPSIPNLMRIQTSIFTANPPVSLFSGATQDHQGDLQFSSLIPRQQKSEPPSQDIKQTQKNDPVIITQLFLRKHVFRNTIHTKILL